MDRLQVLHRQISPLVVAEANSTVASIKINRPKELNAFNYEILTSITILLSEHKGKTVIFSSTLPKSFCAGGDVTAVIENDLMVPEFYRTELFTFFLISRIPKSVVIMQGFSIGAGNGLAMVCKYRIGTNTTKFIMPENGIGLVPDTGASYFFTHLKNKAIGLYLMLTGKPLTGNDCYWAGIVTHYVTDDKIPALHEDVLQTGDVENILNKYASEPQANESFLLRNLPEIEEIFTAPESIHVVLQKLSSKTSKFAEETLKIISKHCPLSICVAFKSFKLGVNKTYEQCLQQDYNIEVQLCFRRSYNWTNIITHRFINKKKGDIVWYPAKIADVTEEMVNAIILNEEGPKLSLPN
jgi:Enoyl-CoA hydratase/carnithine racemase